MQLRECSNDMLADHFNYELDVLAICVVSKQNITSVTMYVHCYSNRQRELKRILVMSFSQSCRNLGCLINGSYTLSCRNCIVPS